MRRFSALQRAENSSIVFRHRRSQQRDVFQCSSASRKFLNVPEDDRQRRLHLFQCSSASRKFLNRRGRAILAGTPKVSVLFSEPKIPQFWNAVFGAIGAASFSALQRAENSSIRNNRAQQRGGDYVSVLFSEPKIPQFELRGGGER